MTTSSLATIRRFFVAVGVALSVLAPLAPAAAAATATAAPVTSSSAATAVSATTPALAATSTAFAAAAAPPAGFRLYTGRNWSWFGPARWTAVYGTYGITVTAPGGIATRDFGFSSTLCSPGTTWAQSAARNFNARQAALVKGSGAKAWKWLSVGKITTSGLQSRKVLTFDATLRNNQVIRGTVIFMYAYNTGQYCYQSSDARTAVRTRYASMIGTLNAIATYTTYRGPGACDPSPKHVC